METMRLIHFKTVVEAGGLIKASALLGITGGGLSKSIKVLEQDIGFELFSQRGRGLELTEAGQEFYQNIPVVLESLRQLVEGAKITSDKSSSVIKLVSFEVFSTYFITKFLSNYQFSQEIEIREAVPGKMEEYISTGESDIGITYEPIPMKGLDYLKIGKIDMFVYANEKASWFDGPQQDIPFVVPINPVSGTPSGVSGLDGWPEHKILRKISYRVGMMESALQLASSGQAAVFIPRFVAELFNETVKKEARIEKINFPKMKTISRDVYLILRKNHKENPFTKKLAKELRGLK